MRTEAIGVAKAVHRTVLAYFNITNETLFAKERRRPYPIRRHILIHFLVDYVKIYHVSYADLLEIVTEGIEDKPKYDHSMFIYAYNVVQGLKDVDPSFRKEYYRIKEFIEQEIESINVDPVD